jgi:hypothetical protein
MTYRSTRALFSQIGMLRECQGCAEAAGNLHLLAATVDSVPAGRCYGLTMPAPGSNPLARKQRSDNMPAIELLDELVSYGFDNAAFQRLHHRGKATTINMHRKYAEKVEFKPNDTNEMVERRLAFVLKAYHATAEARGSTPTD